MMAVLLNRAGRLDDESIAIERRDLVPAQEGGAFIPRSSPQRAGRPPAAAAA
jgi:hypothetical protein